MVTSDRPIRPTVLAVDDDPGFLEALDLILSEDFDFLTAQSGPQALELIGKRRVDVILLDLVMPEMNGFEVLERLRESRSTVPVIIVTAYNDVARVVRGMKAGAYNYVTKPWDDDADLITLIQGALQSHSCRTAVLLLSEEPGALASIEVALQAELKVISSAPARASAFGVRAEAIVIDGQFAEEGEIAALRGIRARFWDVPLVVITMASHDARLADIAALHPAAVFVKPYALDDVLIRLTELLAGRGCSPRGWPRFTPEIRRAVEVLARQYSNPPSASALARAVHISEERLRSAFREALGMSPKEFAKRLQVAIAARLVRETDLRLAEIARRAGFHDESYFSRMFKEARGFRGPTP